MPPRNFHERAIVAQRLPQDFRINEATGKIEEDYGNRRFVQDQMYSDKQGYMKVVSRSPDQRDVDLSMKKMYASQGQPTPQDPRFAIDPRYMLVPIQPTRVIMKSKSTSPLWKDKLGNVDKAVQVYQDVLKEKFGWKKKHATKMVQTDDIELQQLAMLQYQFKQSSHFHKYYKYTNPSMHESPHQVYIKADKHGDQQKMG